MLLVVFALLFAGCLGLWIAGAPALLVFALALAAWIAFYLVLLPKIRTYKVAMGIDDRLSAVEGTAWRWIGLHLQGLKVVILAFLSSSLPFVGQVCTWLAGQNVGVFFGADSGQKVTFYIGAIVFALPFLMSWLHIGAIKDAAVTEPKG